MARFLRDNGLSMVVLGLFAIFLAGQTLTGWCDYNQDRQTRHEPRVNLLAYVTTGAYGEAVFENWESEFLQMGIYVILTAKLYQRGSSESKDPDKPKEPITIGPDSPGPIRKGGAAAWWYSHSLSFALLALFVAAFVLHAITGCHYYNEEARDLGEPIFTTLQYMGSSRFWFESFQNWQSEFLAIGALVILSIWLRERGSPESKEVSAPHSQTGK